MPDLETFHAMTLHAFSEALKKFDSTLPDRLVQQIHQVGQDLEENLDPSNDCNSLYELVDKLENNLENNPDYSHLFELYDEEYSRLQEADRKKERNKGIPPQEESQLPSDPGYGINTAANCQFLTRYQPQSDKKTPNNSPK